MRLERSVTWPVHGLGRTTPGYHGAVERQRVARCGWIAQISIPCGHSPLPGGPRFRFEPVVNQGVTGQLALEIPQRRWWSQIEESESRGTDRTVRAGCRPRSLMTKGGYGRRQELHSGNLAIRARLIAAAIRVVPDSCRTPRERRHQFVWRPAQDARDRAKVVVAAPKLLLLDEPRQACPVFRRQGIDTLKVVMSTGTALLIAEQNVPFMALAERCVLIEGGRVRLSETRAQVAKSDAVKAAYFSLD
jgi:hypothetical protein